MQEQAKDLVAVLLRRKQSKEKCKQWQFKKEQQKRKEQQVLTKV